MINDAMNWSQKISKLYDIGVGYPIEYDKFVYFIETIYSVRVLKSDNYSCKIIVKDGMLSLSVFYDESNSLKMNLKFLLQSFGSLLYHCSVEYNSDKKKYILSTKLDGGTYELLWGSGSYCWGDIFYQGIIVPHFILKDFISDKTSVLNSEIDSFAYKYNTTPSVVRFNLNYWRYI